LFSFFFFSSKCVCFFFSFFLSNEMHVSTQSKHYESAIAKVLNKKQICLCKCLF
jgi:hypothetical protein